MRHKIVIITILLIKITYSQNKLFFKDSTNILITDTNKKDQIFVVQVCSSFTNFPLEILKYEKISVLKLYPINWDEAYYYNLLKNEDLICYTKKKKYFDSINNLTIKENLHNGKVVRSFDNRRYIDEVFPFYFTTGKIIAIPKEITKLNHLKTIILGNTLITRKNIRLLRRYMPNTNIYYDKVNLFKRLFGRPQKIKKCE